MVTARRVICGYFLISGLYTLAAALIWGVNTLFLLDAGLDIVGKRAGLRGTCAAQGLPEVVQVDATPRQAVGT